MKVLLKPWLALVGLAIFISGCSKDTGLLTLQIDGQTMGTHYQVKVVGAENELPEGEALAELIEIELERVNAEMSTYRPDSELSQFNAMQQAGAVEVSDNLAMVVDSSLGLSEISGGAFDVTVGPLVNLWGFGPEGRPEQRPSAEQMAEARSKVGYRYLSIDGNQLSKAIPDLYVDLSAIAKGHGVDRVANLIEGRGFENYMVDIGGELRLKGHNDSLNPWRIAVEKPQLGEQGVQKIITPGDNGLATSGDYRNYFEQDGVRYSHTIDPRSGAPIANHIVSVTVIEQSAMLADGYATALTVMGVKAAMDYAEQTGLAVYIIEKQGEDFVEHVSAAFAPHIVQPKQ